jgi:hypothetical protein
MNTTRNLTTPSSWVLVQKRQVWGGALAYHFAQAGLLAGVSLPGNPTHGCDTVGTGLLYLA